MYLDKAPQMIIGGYAGALCSLVLSMIYYSHSGRKLILLSCFVFSHLMTYVCKLYLITKYVFFPEAYNPQPAYDVVIVPFNSFAIVLHNSTMLFAYLHTWRTVTAGPDRYDYIGWQQIYIAIAILFGCLQVCLNFYLNPDLRQQHLHPFQFLNASVLILIAIIGPVCLLIIIHELIKARRATIDQAQRSALSQSLLYRLLIALVAGSVITCRSVWAIFVLNGSDLTRGRFPSYDLYSSTLDQLYSRYYHGLISGIFIFVVLGTSREAAEATCKALETLSMLCGGKKFASAAGNSGEKEPAGEGGPSWNRSKVWGLSAVDLEQSSSIHVDQRVYFRYSNICAYVTEEGANAIDGSTISILRPASTMASTLVLDDIIIPVAAATKRRASIATDEPTAESRVLPNRYERRALSSPFAVLREEEEEAFPCASSASLGSAQ